MAVEDETKPNEEAPEAREFQEETRAHRLAKLDALRERGIEPYPVRFDRDSTAAASEAQDARIARLTSGSSVG